MACAYVSRQCWKGLLLVAATHAAMGRDKYFMLANKRPCFFFYINMVESFRMAMVNLLWEKTRTRLVDTTLPFQGPGQGQAYPEEAEGKGVGQERARGGGGEEEVQPDH